MTNGSGQLQTPGRRVPAWRGIEVIGTRGMICNHNNTSLGLRLFRRDDSSPAGDLTEVTGLFDQRPRPERDYDADGWRDPGIPCVLSCRRWWEPSTTARRCR